MLQVSLELVFIMPCSLLLLIDKKRLEEIRQSTFIFSFFRIDIPFRLWFFSLPPDVAEALLLIDLAEKEGTLT